MKVLHLSWSDRHGGAARAAFRLDAALKRAGVHSAMLSAAGYLDETGQRHPIGAIDGLLARASARLDQLPLAGYPDREKVLFSAAGALDRLVGRLSRHRADVYHLHWINNGFMKIETFPKLNKPVVWTFHDMWPLTGGCHYSNGCQKFMSSCGACPQLHSTQSDDLSRRIFERKKVAWAGKPFQIVAPSQWLAAVASSSRLVGSSVVNILPNAIDTDAFAPIDKTAARAAFDLPQDRIVLLFGALTSDGDKRKGFHFLAPLLERLSERFGQNQICLAVLGMNAPREPQEARFPVRYLGTLSDDEAIARAYSCADVLVVPSIEDNLPNSVMEAASCGVPSVGFRVGGLPDMIAHKSSGYLAKPFDVDDLAAGILYLVEDPQVAARAGGVARQHAIENYSFATVARRHMDLYAKLMAN